MKTRINGDVVKQSTSKTNSQADLEQVTSGIHALRTVLAMPSMERMNKSSVVGFLGELYVHQFLLQDGWAVEHAGNQSSVDLKATRANREVHIDVKTSSLKHDFKSQNNWGWTLISSGKDPKRLADDTFIVCVALTSDFELHRMFVTNVAKARKFPESPKKQFKNAQHSLVLLEDPLGVDQLSSDERRQLKKIKAACEKYCIVATNVKQLRKALLT